MMRKTSQLQCWALGGLAVGLLALSASSQPPPGEAPVKITVKVPADAVVTVDGHATKQTGTERRFESPPLATGKKSVYKFTAKWNEGGKEKEVTRTVRVQGGKEYRVDFTKPEGVTPPKDKTKRTDKARTDKARTDKARTDKARTDKARTDKARTDKAKADKARTDKGRADKTKPAPDEPRKDKVKPAPDEPLKDKEAEKKAPPKDEEPKLDQEQGAVAPRTREFQFTYAATVNGLRPGQSVRIWLPVPATREEQVVREVSRALPFRGRAA